MRTLFIAIALATPAFATEPPARWMPDTIPWQRTNPDGTRYVLLEGNRDIPGTAFTYAFFIPKGVWDAAHTHAATARVVVIKGNLYLGYGRTTDKAKARSHPAGSVLIVPANAAHFDGAPDEDTIIIGTAVAPWNTLYTEK